MITMKDFSGIEQKYPFLKNGYLVFSLALPISLKLSSDRFFEISLDSKKFLLNSEEIYNSFDPRFGEGKNIEVPSDIFSGFRYSRLNILFADENPKIPEENLKRAYGYSISEAVNNFLNIYRFTVNRPIIQLFDFDFVYDLNIRRVAGKDTKFLQEISYGKNASIQPCQPLLAEDQQEKIDKLLRENYVVSLDNLFLMNAERHMFLNCPREALVLGVNALEFVANSKNVKLKYDWKDWLCKYILHKNVYRGLLQKRIKMLISNNQLSKKVEEAISDRDRVAHGKKSKGSVAKHLKYIKKAILLIDN